jgi:hypothetical protein
MMNELKTVLWVNQGGLVTVIQEDGKDLNLVCTLFSLSCFSACDRKNLIADANMHRVIRSCKCSEEVFFPRLPTMGIASVHR